MTATVNGMYVSRVEKDQPVRFEMRATRGWVDRIDKWRAGQPGIPSRAEAIRRLVEKGLSGGK